MTEEPGTADDGTTEDPSAGDETDAEDPSTGDETGTENTDEPAVDEGSEDEAGLA